MARPVVFEFLADARGLDRGMTEVERRFARMGSQMQKVGRGLTASVTAPIALLGAASAKAASDLEQSNGAIESVFSESAQVLRDFAEEADDAAGLSARAVYEMGARVGASLKGLGLSTADAAAEVIVLEQRAADLAATFGGTTEEAIDAIAALLRGERDPIERYGVALKQVDVDARIAALGLDTTTVAAQKQAQAIATLELFYESTADAAGAFGREQNTAAGAAAQARADFENASAALGQRLLPLMAEGASAASALLEGFSALPQPMQDVILAALGVAAAIGPLLILTGSVLRNLQSINDFAPTLSKTLGKGAGMAGALFLVAEGANAAGDAIADLLNLSRGDVDAQAMTNDLTRLSRGLAELADLKTLRSALSDTRFGIDGLGDAINRITAPSFSDRVQDVTSHLFGLLSPAPAQGARALTSSADALQILDDRLTDLARSDGAEAAEAALAALVAQERLTGEQTEELVALLPSLQTELDRQELAATDAADATEVLGGAQRSTANYVQTLTDRLRLQAEHLQEQADPVLAAIRATDRYEDAQESLNEAIKKHGRNSEEADRASVNLLESVLELQFAVALADGDVDGFNGALNDLERAGLLASDELDRLRKLLNDLPTEKTISVRVASTGRTERTSDPDVVLHPALRARGGGAERHRPYIVGEEGPELFVPGTNGRVVPHGRLVQAVGAQGAAGPSISLTVNNPEPEPASVSLPWALRHAVFLGGI